MTPVIRILHAADFHMDSPYDALPPERAAERRREMRSLILDMFRRAEAFGAQLILLSGDLFDSSFAYHETVETLQTAFGSVSAEIFISPGNHDFCSPASPYMTADFPANVHIFRSPRIDCTELPELGVRVYGAGYQAPSCPALLGGFAADGGDMLNLMVLHGNVGGSDGYCPVTEAEIAASGLDYLALGHVHAFSGVRRTGGTLWAYPGCPEGRGFDETGRKGYLLGSVGRGSAELEFVPAGGREYRTVSFDASRAPDIAAAVTAALPEDAGRGIFRLTVTGERAGGVDCDALAAELAPYFYCVSVRDATRPPRGLWDGEESDTLTGAVLRNLHAAYIAAGDDDERAVAAAAARYVLASLEKREEWRP